jgi:toxin-antitoxin system PIN domain toxin
MLSIDTNILWHGFNADSPQHGAAYAWLQSMQAFEEVAISEFILAEFYVLLRNPAVLKQPLGAADAAAVVQVYRRHPRWRLLGFPMESLPMHEKLWQEASKEGFAFRRIYDVRTALSLLSHGVTEFATANQKDFTGIGFRRVWNPLAS